MAEKRARGRPKAFDDKTAQNTIQSLDRALDILELLARDGGQTLTALAGTLHQSPATAYRALSTLQARGVVEVDENAQTWHIGSGAFRLGSAFLRRTSLVERARPIMIDLMEATGETANLGIERGNKVLFVSQIETHATIRAFFPPGTQGTMHASGIGKALLAYMPEDRVRRIFRAEPVIRFTPNTVTAEGPLIEEMDRIRAAGLAFDNEERTLGMRCIAAPVLDAAGAVVAGISVSGPTTRLGKDQIPGTAEAVRDAARRLSIALGALLPAKKDNGGAD